MNKIKVIALFGKSGAGKDTIKDLLVSNLPNTHEIINCTTRPPRNYEQNGINYSFLTDEEFGEKILNGSMIEATQFRGWFYGTAFEELDKNKLNIGVFNIAAIECLLQDSRLDVLPIYISANDKERLLRNLYRKEKPDCMEICRRFQSDETDFRNIDFKYEKFYNNKINKKTLQVLKNKILRFLLETLTKND